jgi:hypothetical protein
VRDHGGDDGEIAGG